MVYPKQAFLYRLNVIVRIINRNIAADLAKRTLEKQFILAAN